MAEPSKYGRRYIIREAGKTPIESIPASLVPFTGSCPDCGGRKLIPGAEMMAGNFPSTILLCCYCLLQFLPLNDVDEAQRVSVSGEHWAGMVYGWEEADRGKDWSLE